MNSYESKCHARSDKTHLRLFNVFFELDDLFLINSVFSIAISACLLELLVKCIEFRLEVVTSILESKGLLLTNFFFTAVICDESKKLGLCSVASRKDLITNCLRR